MAGVGLEGSYAHHYPTNTSSGVGLEGGPMCFLTSGHKGVVARGPLAGAGDRPALREQGLGAQLGE